MCVALRARKLETERTFVPALWHFHDVSFGRIRANRPRSCWSLAIGCEGKLFVRGGGAHGSVPGRCAAPLDDEEARLAETACKAAGHGLCPAAAEHMLHARDVGSLA